jgi:transglutaminase-like putative cysteine protease
VSGYYDGDVDRDTHYLHAWGEAYLSGAGWRGFDPTLGLAVADRHVAIAASTDPQRAAPVSATYRGTNVEAELHADVVIERQSTVALLAS